MSKRSKLLFFHSWLNLTMKYLFLGLLNLFVSVIVKPATSSPPHGRMAEEKEHKFRGVPVFHIPQQRKWQCVNDTTT